MDIRPANRNTVRRSQLPPTTFQGTNRGAPLTGRCNGISDEKINIQAKSKRPTLYTSQNHPCQHSQPQGGTPGVRTPAVLSRKPSASSILGAQIGTPLSRRASATNKVGTPSVPASRRGSHTSLLRGEPAALSRKASATSRIGAHDAVLSKKPSGLTLQAAGDAAGNSSKVGSKANSRICSRTRSKTSIASSKHGYGENQPHIQQQQSYQQPEQHYQPQGQYYQQQGQYPTQEQYYQQQALNNQSQGQYNQQEVFNQQSQYAQGQVQQIQQSHGQFNQQGQGQQNTQAYGLHGQQEQYYPQEHNVGQSQQYSQGNYKQGQVQNSPQGHYYQQQYNNSRQGHYIQPQIQHTQQGQYEPQGQYNHQVPVIQQGQYDQQQENNNQQNSLNLGQQQVTPQAVTTQAHTVNNENQNLVQPLSQENKNCTPQVLNPQAHEHTAQHQTNPADIQSPQCVQPESIKSQQQTSPVVNQPHEGEVLKNSLQQSCKNVTEYVDNSGGDQDRLRGGGTTNATVPGACPPCSPCPPCPMVCPQPCGTYCSVAVTTGQQKLCKYIQPPIVKSFKPNAPYCPPQLKMEDGTVYRKSYMPVHSEKEKPFVQPSTICLGQGKISSDTVNRMSYKCYDNFKPPCPILPCEHNLIGDGPMQEMTTSRHDYVPKPYSKPATIENKQNLYLSDCPLSKDTTFRMSYQGNPVAEKVVPIRPVPALEGPCGKMSGDTVHRMSYLPWQQPQPVDMPWADKKPYAKPCLPMSNDTIYRKSFFANCGDNRREAIRPNNSRNPFGTGCDFTDKTVYKMSYIPNEVQQSRPDAVRPTNNLALGCGPFESNTVNRMSYKGHDARPPCPIRPCEHNLLGEGPMQEMTTQRHDYVPKPFSKAEAVHPRLNIYNSDCPLSDKTTQRLSYQKVCNYEKAQPVRPVPALERVTGKFEDRTIQRMSYQPWQAPERGDMPWAEKRTYVPPKLRMEGNTVYRMSFDAPGEYVDCPPGDNTCVPCPQPPCPPINCCAPCPTAANPCCCCPFPTAAC